MDKPDIKTLADSRCPSHSGILDGTCKGEKWVYTNGGAPVFAVTYSYCVGGCGIFGEVTEAESIKAFLLSVFKELKENGTDEFEFSCENEVSTEQVLSLFSEKTADSETEYSYRYLNRSAFYEDSKTPDGYRILPLNEELLDSLGSYSNTEMVCERMENSWEKDDFLKLSCGFVAIKDKEIVGIIFGSGRYENYLPIDIEVAKPHRRKGLAEELTRRFIKGCLNMNFIAQWDCVESNEASRKLAERTGFELFKQRDYYWFDIDTDEPPQGL